MPPLYDVVLVFGKVGLFSLGGGNSMIKLIEDECVHGRAWLTAQEYASMIGVTFAFPGLTAVKLAALVGLKVAGPLGLLLGVIALNAPGIVLVGVFYRIAIEYQHVAIVQKLMTGVQFGALALLAAAVVSVGAPLVTQKASWMIAALTLGLFSAMVFFRVSAFVGFICFLLAWMFLL